MKKFHLFFQKTPLYLAIEAENIDIVKLLLAHDGVDVNEANEI